MASLQDEMLERCCSMTWTTKPDRPASKSLSIKWTQLWYEDWVRPCGNSVASATQATPNTDPCSILSTTLSTPFVKLGLFLFSVTFLSPSLWEVLWVVFSLSFQILLNYICLQGRVCDVSLQISQPVRVNWIQSKLNNAEAKQWQLQNLNQVHTEQGW